MSHRPILMKRANRVRKALRQQLPAHIDLVQWLKMHGYASTTGEAEKIILARRVKSESHVLGVVKGRAPKASAQLKIMLGRELTDDDFEESDVVERYVPARLATSIYVTA